jgi:hypothetical protein
MTIFVCPRCGFNSYNPHDFRERYCGRCHIFIDDKIMTMQEISFHERLEMHIRYIYGFDQHDAHIWTWLLYHLDIWSREQSTIIRTTLGVSNGEA